VSQNGNRSARNARFADIKRTTMTWHCNAVTSAHPVVTLLSSGGERVPKSITHEIGSALASIVAGAFMTRWRLQGFDVWTGRSSRYRPRRTRGFGRLNR
jgi:hypothetical protein